MTERIRILIVDDHPAIRRGLVATLEPEPDMQIVGTAASCEEAISVWKEMRPDITIMDLRLSGEIAGLDAIREIRKLSSSARIIVFSALTGDEDVYQALRAGAITFLTKDTPDEQLVQTIRDVHAGARPVAPEIAQKLAGRVTQSSLTAREVEVLELVSRGLRNKDIGLALCISEETVKGHMRSILSKLEVDDRTRAAVLAAQRGIIHLD